MLPLALVCLMPASAQTIARVQFTDNDLNCSQIYAEAQKMDTVIELAGPGLPAAPLLAPTPVSVVNPLAQMGAGGYGNQASFYQVQAQQAMAASSNPEVRAAANDPNKVAQYAPLIQNPQLAVAARNAAAAGVSSASIQSQLSAVGAMQQAAAGARAVPLPSALPTLVAAVRPAGPSMGAQALARKDYLTQLFLTRGCKMSEVQK